MPGKKVDCNNCGKSMRSDNLKRHEKNCNRQDSYPLEAYIDNFDGYAENPTLLSKLVLNRRMK